MSTAEDLRNLQEVYEGYVRVFGQEAQMKMLLEEALEFAHAALKLDRKLRRSWQNQNLIHMPYAPSHPGWQGPEMRQLLLEAVDALVMIGQLPWITGNERKTMAFLKERHEFIYEKMKERLAKASGGD